MKPNELKDHLINDCPLAEVTCNICNGNVKRGEIDQHDCITSLKAELKALSEGKGLGTGPASLADFDIDPEDGNSH